MKAIDEWSGSATRTSRAGGRVAAGDAATIGRSPDLINPATFPQVPTFVQYNAQTEALISYILERLDEDDALAGAMRYPNLIRAVTLVGPLHDNINSYRRAVHRWADSDSEAWLRAPR